MKPTGPKKDKQQSVIGSKTELHLTKEDMKKYQKIIKEVDERDAKGFIPNTNIEEGLSGEELIKMVKREKKNK